MQSCLYTQGQQVVFTTKGTNLTGKITDSNIESGEYKYTVLCENGKVYYDLPVDTHDNYCIKSKLTKAVFKQSSDTQYQVASNEGLLFGDEEENPDDLIDDGSDSDIDIEIEDDDSLPSTGSKKMLKVDDVDDDVYNFKYNQNEFDLVDEDDI